MIYAARLDSKKKRSTESFAVLVFFVTICRTNEARWWGKTRYKARQVLLDLNKKLKQRSLFKRTLFKRKRCHEHKPSSALFIQFRQHQHIHSIGNRSESNCSWFILFWTINHVVEGTLHKTNSVCASCLNAWRYDTPLESSDLVSLGDAAGLFFFPSPFVG